MSKEIDELLIKEHDSATLMNYSPMRANFLRFINFEAGQKVLLLDGESKAITDYLLSIDVELDESWSGSFPDKESYYDFVICVGAADKKIFTEASRVLKNDGSFILVIQNKAGLMSQTGVPNFFTHNSFDSIMNRDENHSITKKDLALLVKTSRFEDCKWYYPYPDYRLSTEIYSDDRLPSKGLVTGPSPSYDGDYVITIDEKAAFEDAISIGQFPEIANSFMLICKPKKDSAPVLQYAKFNSLRAPEYRIHTAIFKDSSDEKYVLKIAEEEIAGAHLNKIARNYELLKETYTEVIPVQYKIEKTFSNDLAAAISFDYINGSELVTIKDNFFKDKQSAVMKLEKVFGSIFAISDDMQETFKVTDEFKTFFAGCDGKAFDGEMGISVSNIDSILSNFLETRKGIYCLDYEWVLDFLMPIKYLKYRFLLYFVRENFDHFSDSDFSENDLFEEFGITGEALEECKKMELQFQLKVHGQDLRYNYLPHYQWRAWDKAEWKKEHSLLAKVKRKLSK